MFVVPAELFQEKYGTEWAITITLVPNGVGYLISSPLAGKPNDTVSRFYLLEDTGNFEKNFAVSVNGILFSLGKIIL